MKATPTRIPDIVLIEPKVFGDDRGSSSKVSTGAPSVKRPGSMSISCRTTISKSAPTSCAACIISWRHRRSKLVRVTQGEFLTWRSISGARQLWSVGGRNPVGGEQETAVDSRRAGAWFRRALERRVPHKTTDYYAGSMALHRLERSRSGHRLADRRATLLSAKDAAGAAFRGPVSVMAVGPNDASGVQPL